jgi:hypothetical protein
MEFELAASLTNLKYSYLFLHSASKTESVTAIIPYYLPLCCHTVTWFMHHFLHLEQQDNGCPKSSNCINVVFWGWGDWVHMICQPLFGLLYQFRMIEDYDVKQSVECVAGETGVLRENLPHCHFAHHIPHMTWPGPPTNRLSYGTAIEVMYNHPKLLDLKSLYALSHTYYFSDRMAENMEHFNYYAIMSHTGACSSIVVKALCYKPEGCRFNTWWGDCLNLPNPSGHTRPWGLLSL